VVKAAKVAWLAGDTGFTLFTAFFPHLSEKSLRKWMIDSHIDTTLK
jgi:hypothetical protein